MCPLTSLEDSLRERGGAARYPGDFVGQLAHRLIFYDFPPWVFAIAYISFAAVVAITFILLPPRWPTRSRDARTRDAS